MRIGSRLSTHLALAPALLIALVAYCGAMGWTIWISFTNSRMLPSSVFVGLRQYSSLATNERWLTSVQNIAIFGLLFIAMALVLGFMLAALIDQRVRAESLLRSVFLYPFSMSFIVTGLAWRWLLDPTLGIEKVGHDLGLAWFRFDWLVRPERVIYTLVLAAVWHAAGLVMAIMLAGLRGVDPEIWKAVRVDGIPAWRAYLFIVVPLMRGSFATAVILLAVSVARLYDLSVAMTNGGPGIASEVPAKFVMDHLFERGNVGPCDRRRDDNADYRGRGACAADVLAVPPARTTPAMSAAIREPRGRRPWKPTPARLGLYAFLLISALFFLMPLYVMVVTSLKGMPEIRQAHLLNLPAAPSFAAWSKAWFAACTGLSCNGIRVGFINSLRIMVPSVIVSILVGAITGYALSFWRPRGAVLLFGVLIAVAFIPYQVFIYPLVRIFSYLGINNSVPGIVVIHTIFGLPTMTLIFRNHFAALPEELFKAARVDGAGFWRIFGASCCRWRCRSSSLPSSCRSPASGTTSSSASYSPAARICR